MAQQKHAGLGEGAENFQHLRELDIDSMSFYHNVSLPHGLERAALRESHFACAVWLDKCKCATGPPR